MPCRTTERRAKDFLQVLFVQAIVPRSKGPGPSLGHEQPEINRVRHGLVSCVVRVQVVSAIVCGEQLRRVRGITKRRVEVEDGIEPPARADPVVHGLSCNLVVRCEVAGVRSFVRG